MPKGDERPLVVDVDGTLVRSDLLVESALGAVRETPFNLVRMVGWLGVGRARLKSELASRVPLDPATLPYDQDVLATLRREHAAGRPIYLASASDRRYVEAIAAHLGLFDGVFASDGATNLKADAKAQMLVDAFGEHGFDYVGNHADDLAIWERACRILIVDAPKKVLRRATRDGADHEILVPRRMALAAWLRALRPHQWLKNLLVFVPIAAGHVVTPASVGYSLLAFVAFSLVASGVYLLNDLLDLPSDRAHPRKSARSLASGAIPIQLAPPAAAGLMLSGAVLALFAGPALLGVIAIYVAVTCLYSIHLKRKALLDVITLAGLYTLRVLGGAAAVGIIVSQWLLAFALFVFLALAIVKRHAELVDAVSNGQGDPRGRGYRTQDLPMLGSLGAAAGYIAVLVLALYISTPQVQELYSHPQLLWGVCGLLLYWVSRMLLASQRGEVDDDPLVFAVKDRPSQAVLVLGAVLVVVAT
ncbi:MAG: UbiA family prenyltransferase [Halofilum sp. (in: g-proteobacteria)]